MAALCSRARAHMGERESEVLVEELEGVRATGIFGSDLLNLEDLNRGPASAMTTAHLHVHLLNGAGHGDIAVFLEHVHGVGARLVPQPNTKDLDDGRVLLVDLVHGENLTVRLLHALQLAQKVPETRLGNHLVRREDAHAVHRRLLILLGPSLAGNHTADHMVLLQPSHCTGFWLGRTVHLGEHCGLRRNAVSCGVDVDDGIAAGQ